MFWAIIATIITSVGKVFFKKTVEYKIKPELNDFLGFFVAIICIGIIFFLGKFNIILYNSWSYVLLFITFIFFFFQISINQKVFQNEKYSALVPYDNIGKVLTVIFGIFILGEKVSVLSLGIFIIIIILIFLKSVDFKNLKISKYIGLFCFAQFLSACANLSTGYILIHNTSLDYYTVYILMSAILVGLISFKKGQFKDLKHLDNTFYIYRFIASITWIGWLINIILINNLGLTVTTLLGFLGLSIGLLTSFILFNDKPKKNDIIFIIIITTLVSLGFYFK